MNKPFLGFHYDIARGTYLKPDVFCQALRLAADSGYTHFLPYLENMILLPSMARACPACAYTAEDWARFEAVANEVGIELVPHFNAIGHTELISPAYPELCAEVSGSVRPDFDPEKPATREWLKRCLGEFCDLSHSQYFLIGGDEWQPPRRLLAQPGFDVAQAWVEQINAAVEVLVQRGRQPIVWHDMLLHYPAARAALSKQAVIAFWFYDYDSDYAALSTFKALGFKTLMASAVFGGALPTLGRRCVSALQRARVAAAQHGCDGMMVTSWEACRWELEAYNIPMATRVLRGEEPPPAITDALARFEAWLKLPSDSVLARQWQAQMEVLLTQTAWDMAPDMRRVLRASLRGDVQDDVASYVQYHHASGHGYDRAAHGRPQPVWSVVPASHAVPASAFGLTVVSDDRRGDVLQFANGAESFVVYPKFGASLQGWQRAGQVIIPAPLENFLKRDMLPGGYRSYTAVSGLRPIWGMGTHSNPCILWQYPWSWSVAEQGVDRVTVELRLELPAGLFTVRITTVRGQSGFVYEARCVNALEHAYGAFNFNLPLPFGLADVTDLKLAWEEQGAHHEMSVAGQATSAFWIPAAGPLTVSRPGWGLRIDASPEQTAGYGVDWNAGFITPDLHGVYRPLQSGEETVTRWQFRAASCRP